MPIFKVKVAIETKRYGAIVVEADSLSEALAYARDNDGWHEEDIDGDLGIETRTPCNGHEIKDVADLPYSYKGDSLPWGGNGKRTITDILGAP